MTITELAETYGRKPDTLQRKAKDLLPLPSNGKWSIHSAVTEDEARIILGDRPPENPAPIRRKKEIRTTQNTETISGAKPAVEQLPPAPAAIKYDTRFWSLTAVAVCATLASVQNMYRVTAELSEANMSAILLTIVLSASAIVFVVSGVRRWWTVALAALLIAYESMCNMVRIHAGLFTKTENPTRFLGQFCETFQSGTHQSAFFLAAFTAFFIAAVQYAAVFELNKKPV